MKNVYSDVHSIFFIAEPRNSPPLNISEVHNHKLSRNCPLRTPCSHIDCNIWSMSTMLKGWLVHNRVFLSPWRRSCVASVYARYVLPPELSHKEPSQQLERHYLLIPSMLSAASRLDMRGRFLKELLVVFVAVNCLLVLLCYEMWHKECKEI